MDVRRAIAQTNRYVAAVRKLLSIKGEEHMVDFGVHLEEERAEFAFLKGERRFSQFNSATSAAGTRALVGVANPPNSGVLVVVTSAFCSVEAAGVVLDLSGVGGVISPPNFSTGPMFCTDSRTGSQGAGTFSGATNAVGIATGAAGAIGGHIFSEMISIAANDNIDFIGGLFGPRVHSFVLAPGALVCINTNAVGVHTINATFTGYERSLESGELIG